MMLNLFLCSGLLILVSSVPSISTADPEETLDPSSSLSTDFETSLSPWYDSSTAGVKWSLEETGSPLEPLPAPQPDNGVKYLRAVRNPPNIFGTAALRSPSVIVSPGDEFSLAFWIRSKNLWTNNLEVYWLNGTREELLLELYAYSSPSNFEWRVATQPIPVAVPTETNFRIYGYVADNEEDAIAIDDIVVGRPSNPDSTTATPQTTPGGNSTGTGSSSQSTTATTSATTQNTGSTGTTPNGPTIPSEVECIPTGALANSDSKCMRYNELCYCRYKPYGWSWPYADWYCRNASMNLVSLQSSTEERWVSQFAGGGGYWTSGFRPSTAEDWKWRSTGEPFNYTNWNTPQEAEETGFTYITTQPLTWYATDGITSGLFIVCEEPRFTYPTSPPPTKQPPQSGCPLDEEFMTWYPGQVLNGKQYCFSAYWADWENADRYCRSANLRVVSLETREESTLINQHIAEKGYDIGGGFWTSGFCDSASSSWKWSTTGAAFTYDLFNSTADSVCGFSTSGNYVWFSNSRDGKWFSNSKYYYRQIVCEQQ